jgi:hypothetical protein
VFGRKPGNFFTNSKVCLQQSKKFYFSLNHFSVNLAKLTKLMTKNYIFLNELATKFGSGKNMQLIINSGLPEYF